MTTKLCHPKPGTGTSGDGQIVYFIPVVSFTYRMTSKNFIHSSMCVIQGFLVRFIFLIDLFVHGFSLVITAPFTIVHVLLQVVNTAYPVME